MLRYASDIPFPAYAFVPGRHPHPVTDPQGHSFGNSHVAIQPLDPQRPWNSTEFLFALDLFNAGYYWEAHEVWEGLWIAAGRKGCCADFLKGLIKLSAAGVKAREGQPVGVCRHAKRAVELFQSVSLLQASDRSEFAGLGIKDLIVAANNLVNQPVSDNTLSESGRPVLALELKLLTGSTGTRK